MSAHGNVQGQQVALSTFHPNKPMTESHVSPAHHPHGQWEDSGTNKSLPLAKLSSENAPKGNIAVQFRAAQYLSPPFPFIAHTSPHFFPSVAPASTDTNPFSNQRLSILIPKATATHSPPFYSLPYSNGFHSFLIACPTPAYPLHSAGSPHPPLLCPSLFQGARRRQARFHTQHIPA